MRRKHFSHAMAAASDAGRHLAACYLGRPIPHVFGTTEHPEARNAAICGVKLFLPTPGQPALIVWLCEDTPGNYYGDDDAKRAKHWPLCPTPALKDEIRRLCHEMGQHLIRAVHAAKAEKGR